ncbi:LacI family DNA-binding transcriptional regulator [Kribbella sandramycini]|uniref:LacI family DNA-binding transcriptional regulator n=1 Tax=Kribbella sandramycini TaxID=60450 RepID=A0A7Y4L004_9ACTN|nr:LacI family DNA-binding transcriptional regulator [Kribbella sandramycini]MBB6565523.1 LacI family transcriptional regulator [Kribbella sandramycini]NOL41790.1 LacI family DNA-binding transcriptional regulator [Kribbella sandramycini]
MPERRVTVREVAAATGVSIATVSRVLNQQGRVAPETRALVERAVEQLGLRAPTPRGGTPKPVDGAVFVRCPYVLTDYFGLIVSSIAETLDRHGRQVVLNAGEAAAQDPVLARLPAQRELAGAILILPPEPPEDLIHLTTRRFPLVVVDPRTTLPPHIPSVSAAHHSGARQLTAHLLSLGHTRIGVIAGPREWLAADARLSGHHAALADAGILPTPAHTRHTHPTTPDGYQAALDLLSLTPRPTALIAFNDKAAIGALQAAASLNLTVPTDLSIAGFDDLDLAQATTPPLTTVRQPLAEMGRLAATQLTRLLTRHPIQALHLELATELVVRASTAPVP